jgi:gamma-glutamyltranspeptidase / glutathione hydrolase
MVATSQPLASEAALRVLREGGNAVDAAIAAAAVLNVVEPMMTGIGGDVFALVFMQADGHPVGLNASGWSGSRARLDAVRAPGRLEGIQAVTVPGAVAGWYLLHERYGRLPMNRLLEPAADYAESGFPVSPVVAEGWALAAPELGQNPAAARVFLPGGRSPRTGEVFRNPDLGRSLRTLAEGGRDAFYGGELARRIVETSDRLGGFLTQEDFREYEAEWVEPLSTPYRGYDVFEMPPNTQGLVVLEMLNILEGFDLADLGHNTAEYLHRLIEAKRLAFADRDTFVADPAATLLPVAQLTSKEYASLRRVQIDPRRANPDYRPGTPMESDTVCLSVVDRDRNAVSFINSLYFGFGSGIVADGTGIALHNRGSGFSLVAGHRNSLAARKRPFHTLIPGMVLADGAPWFAFGVMGGDMQAQGHVQVLANLIDFGMDPQTAGDAPRVRHFEGEGVALESSIPAAVRQALARKGHTVLDTAPAGFGGYQGILIDGKSGVLWGGSDHRKDGLALGW